CLFGGLEPAELLESATLTIKPSDRELKATRVRMTRAAAVFYFPREVDGQPAIQPADKKAEFRCSTAGARGSAVASFDLGKMVRDGKPDL
ncbi:MAG TPA: hypothetical protein VGA39_06895, partial [Candidatus Acidoferrales bacterium]